MIQNLRTLRTRMPRWGFTLVELALVLGIAGILFAGLWRLMSGGNQQLRDQSAASAQTQLISAVKGYLTSPDGQVYMTANNTATTPFTLALPATNTSNANCQTNYANVNLKSFCNYLPAGFTTASANSYSQTFNIEVIGDGTGTVLVPRAPNTFSFMILTTGGTVIPDSSGGRIAASIGGDGGFIYSNNVCGSAPSVQSWACGAYGAWSTLVTSYGFAAPGTGGYIATRTYYSSEQAANLPWLARTLYSNDPSTQPNFNTMRTSMLFATSAPTANSLYFNTTTIPVPAAGLGGITMNGGSIGMNAGSISMAGGALSTGIGGGVDVSGGTLTLNQGFVAGTIKGVALTSGLVFTGPATTMTITDQTALCAVPGGCSASLQLNGDQNVTGWLNANQLYANGFLYASDRRLKTNIQPLTHSLETVEKLQPVSFTFKASGGDSLGVIAQDIEKIYPQLVTTLGTGMKSVNYMGLVAPLIGAVQELKKENDDLHRQVNDQELRLEKLEKGQQAPSKQ